MGISKKNSKMGISQYDTFNSIVKNAKKTMRMARCPNDVVNYALAAAKYHKKEHKSIPHPRIIPVPKTGGILSVIPVLATISALGGLKGGSNGILRAADAVVKSRKNLKKCSKYDKITHVFPIGMSHSNQDIYLEKYKNGFGLFFMPYEIVSKNV